MSTTRRHFLIGAGGAMAAFGGLRVGFAGGGNSYSNRVLVDVFLRGGADGLNLVPPMDGDDYGYYQALRPQLHIRNSLALELGNTGFGFHPRAGALRELYDDGALAIIQATGLPEPNLSHFEAEALRELGTPFAVSTTSGWLARHFDSSPHLSSGALIPALAASYYSPTSWLGEPSTLTLSYPQDFALNRGSWNWGPVQQQAVADLYGGSSALDVAGAQATSAMAIISQEDWENYAPSNGAVYPEESDFARQLAVIAQMIKLDVGLHVATINKDGWDTHANQGTGNDGEFAVLVDDISNSLKAFYQDLQGAIGPRVTVVVHSEFGRRSYENADAGIDHGFGNVMMVIGEQVNGGQIYGTFPGLSQNELYLGEDLDVTTDFRRVFSEVLIRRLGNPNLGTVFPGYQDYQPIGIVQGQDLPPNYGSGGGNDMIFTSGFE